MATTLVAYVLLASFFVTEKRLRQGVDAESLCPGDSDRGSTRGVAGFFGVALGAVLVAPLLNLIPLGRLPAFSGWTGIALMIAGIALRSWANAVLGPYYTRT